MIKIDYKKLWSDHIWFGWHRIPNSSAINQHRSRVKYWYFLGWDFAFMPMIRKGTNPPEWYQKHFMKNFK